MTLAAVGFDLDFTLWDQNAFARSFFDEVAGELGRRLGQGPRQVAEALHGSLERLTLAHPALFDHALHLLGAWEPRLVRELVDRYHRHRPAARPYPCAEAALARLRSAGCRLFLVTDGPVGAQRHKLQAMDLAAWFEVKIFTGELPEQHRKPSPVPFQLACQRLGVTPEHCAYVGDDPAADFHGPRCLGMVTIGVATGPHMVEQPGPGWEPDLWIRSLEDLDIPLLEAEARVTEGRP